MTIPTQSQPLTTTVEELEQERSDLQAKLQVATTGQKARLATAIKALNRRIESGRVGRLTAWTPRTRLLACCVARRGPGRGGREV